jgi:replication factor C subunit 3/5
VCNKEGLSYCAPLGQDIAKKSERNLRRALLMLETCRVQSYPFSPEQQIQLPAWEDYVCSLAKVVLQEQSPAGYVCNVVGAMSLGTTPTDRYLSLY